MTQYTESSLIFRSLKYLNNWFVSSFTYKVLNSILSIFKHSLIYNGIISYLNRDSSLKTSGLYKFCSKVFCFFDRLWDKLYKTGAACGESSVVISFLSSSFGGFNSYEASGLVILFFSIGLGTASLIRGTLGTTQILFTGLGLLASLLLFIGKAKWNAALKNSKFWQIALYFFD